MSRYNPEIWEETASGRAGGDAAIFARAITLTAETVQRLAPGSGRWLDLGGGTGTLARLLQAPGRRVISLDLDPAMVRFAARQSSGGPAESRIGWCVGRVEALPFAAASFDGVTATSLLGTLPDHEPLVREVARVVRPGGFALITVTNRASWLLRLNHALPRRWVASAGNRSGPRDYRLPAVDEVIASLERAGFEVEEKVPFNYLIHVGGWAFPPPKVSRSLEKTRAPFALRMARNYLLIARKPASTSSP